MIAAGRSGLAPLSEVQPSCGPHLQYDVVPMIRQRRIVEIKTAQYFNRRGKSVCHSRYRLPKASILPILSMTAGKLPLRS